MFGLATEIVDTDGLWHIIQQAGTPLLFVVGVALGVGFGYWLVARGPMGKALQTAGAALEENARAFTTLMRTITDQNEQIIALQNSVDEALDAKRAMRKELDDAEKRMALRDAEHVTELERVHCEFAAKVAELEKAIAARDKRIGDLERKLAAKDARIDELLARIDELEKAHHEELEKALTDRVHVEEKLAALQAKVNHAQAVSEAAVGDCAETGADVDAGKGVPDGAGEGG